MSAMNMVSPQHASKKPCTSASCCSPSRLWKHIQLLISGDQREEFRKLTSDTVKLPHIVNVLLTSRLSNNPLVYNSKLSSSTMIDRRIVDKFGKLSATDLNALEIALLKRHDHIAYAIIMVLKRNVSQNELKQFLNHQWGKENFSALHLASFWGMSKLVRLLIDLGADPFVQNHRQLRPIDCTTHTDTINILKQQQQQQPTNITITTTPLPQHPKVLLSKRPSLLLKKAEKSLHRPLVIDQHYFNNSNTIVIDDQQHHQNSRTPTMSPLSFSSSSSSSSSFSSLSSIDYHWTPPTSPSPSIIEEQETNSLQQQLAKVSIIQQDEEEQEDIMAPLNEMIKEKEQQPISIQRPGCFPRHSSSSSHTTHIENNNNKQVVLQKQKKVHFNPQTMLTEACIRGDLNEVRDLLENDDYFIQCDTIRDFKDRSLLHIAMVYGQEHIVEFLHDKINVNHVDNDGWTCLHYAATLGLWRSVQFLTSLTHCNVDARTNHGLKVEDLPKSDFGKRKCKNIIDRSLHGNNNTTIIKRKSILSK